MLRNIPSMSMLSWRRYAPSMPMCYTITEAFKKKVNAKIMDFGCL